MQLPVRILGAAPSEPVFLVDGVFDAAGLNLSHWPGHRTPAHLRHDLSTGSVLAFARLPEAERRALTAGCVAIANNHYDTDGTCALFAARHPELALPRAQALLDAARAGDFFQLPSRAAFRIDAIVGGLGEPASPLADSLRGLDDLARWQALTDHLLERFAALLDGDVAPYAALFEGPEARLDADFAALAAAARTEHAALDLCVYRGPADFGPGRHAFHGASAQFRVLLLGGDDARATARLVFSTLSWFDLVSRPRLPRPDLDALAARLNSLEGTAADADVAWRAQPITGAAPELWFGAAGVPKFAEHNEHLAPSALGARRIEAEVRAALTPAPAGA